MACTDFKSGSDIEINSSSLQPPANGAQPLGGTPWSCLDPRYVPPAEPIARSTVSYTVTVVDSVTNEPPVGLSVQACDDVDITCARPVSPRTGPSADGRVRLSLAAGFDGYFEVLAEGTVPTRLYPDGLVDADEDGAILELIDEETAGLLAAGAGVELVPETGLVLARAFDCNGALSSGVSFANDSGGTAFAFIDGLPIPGPVTGGEGLVVFANVPTGFTYIEGTIAQTGVSMGSTTVESRPGWLVYADVRPPP